MMTSVLVHGGCHGAWVWDALLPLLDHEAIAIDLPGRGSRPGDIASITGMEFADAVVEAAGASAAGALMLVGHSMAGLSLLRSAERLGPRLKHLVFIACPLPGPGRSLADVMAAVALSRGAPSDFDLGRGLSYEQARAIFYDDLDEPVARDAFAKLTPEAMRPFHEKLDLAHSVEGVGRTYVRTLADPAVPLKLQDAAIALLDPVQVIDVAGGHSPMIKYPEIIAEIINHIARSTL